jgi:ABC-type transport system involved in multi-copper enzyme maturation permease subunit
MIVEQKSVTQDQVGTARNGAAPAPNPLLQVAVWELKRLSVNIWSWVAAAISLLLFLGIIWFKHAWTIPGPDRSIRVVMGTSAVGLLLQFINALLLVFALFIPFVVADGVTRDYKQRMHEVLMATPVPSWAYVWGRFLATLCVSLLLAVFVLIAENVMGSILAQMHPEMPVPVFAYTLIIWAVVILPAALFLTGVGFTLGTLLPRRSTSVMLGMLIAWVLLYTLGNNLFNLFDRLYVYLDPTSMGILGTLYPPFIQSVQTALANVPADQQASTLLQLQSVFPDLSAWALPHLGLAAFGVFLAGLAAVRFQRFQDVLS